MMTELIEFIHFVALLEFKSASGLNLQNSIAPICIFLREWRQTYL